MKYRPKKKSFLDSLRNVGIVIALLAVLLVLFSIASVVTNFGSSIDKTITGEVIKIKNDGSEEINNSAVNNFEEPKCWTDSGLNEQDFVVIGNAVSGLDCPSNEKKDIRGVLKDNCAIIYITDEGYVELCSDGSKPNINVNLIKESGANGNLSDFGVPERNYYGYILFFIALIIVVLFWREYEMSVRTSYDIRAEKAYLERRAMKRHIEDRKKPIEKKEIYVPNAPFYDEDAARNKMVTEAKMKKSDIQITEINKAKKNNLISEFNKLSDSINESIILGRLHESRKNYVKLFDIYAKLILLVSEGNRKNLDGVMEYLCTYLGSLEKLKGTKREGVEDKARKEKSNTIKPKGKILTMDELETMKNLIKEKHYMQAKNMFQNENIKDFEIKNVAKNIVHKKDKLDEIEVLHDKVMKKGVVNVAEEDYYRFMMDMDALREQLKKKIKNKKKS
ncbi:MAG: hypothetical protein Q8Q42_03255 [Nanoarchaeota archaeon]|nr:hypothetical protein [Nanoarchaeota archaeon]